MVVVVRGPRVLRGKVRFIRRRPFDIIACASVDSSCLKLARSALGKLRG